MNAVVQARLDAEAQATLKRLVKRTKLTASEVVREGLRSFEERLAEQERSSRENSRLIGVGEFESAATDLAPDKKHMEAFGRKWRVDERGNGRWDW
jgi:Arc/MetJ-type ribon-helix-helix transcriptional regulator